MTKWHDNEYENAQHTEKCDNFEKWQIKMTEVTSITQLLLFTGL